VPAKPRRPGLAKTRQLPLVRQRSVELWQSADYRWRELFETADVMSEGAARVESSGAVYYGSTSVLLAVVSHGGKIPDAEADALCRLLAGDPHARLRAIRIACLEAQVRSGGVLGRVDAELAVRRDPRGVRVDIEVQAQIVAQSTRRGRRG
jgi:hypothetical protein